MQRRGGQLPNTSFLAACVAAVLMLGVVVVAPAAAQQATAPWVQDDVLQGRITDSWTRTDGHSRCSGVADHGTDPNPHYAISLGGLITRMAGFDGLQETPDGQGFLVVWAIAPGTAHYRALHDCGYWDITITFSGPTAGEAGYGAAPALARAYPRPQGTVDMAATSTPLVPPRLVNAPTASPEAPSVGPVSPGPTPTAAPPAVVTPSRQTCPVADVMGWMEPTQGVWQDDYVFPDQPGKQLTRLDGTHLLAELDMVRGRPTLLFGTRAASTLNDGPGNIHTSRQTIAIQGMASGTRNVPVQWRFTVQDGAGLRTIFQTDSTAPGYSVPLDPPCGELKPFRIELNATNGVPWDHPFTFDAAGPYFVTGNLVRADSGEPTGLLVNVDGTVRETKLPSVHFVPVLLTADAEAPTSALHLRGSDQPETTAAGQLRAMREITADLAQHTSEYVVDHFPLAATPPPPFVVEPARVLPELNGLEGDKLQARLVTRFATSAFLQGAGRVVLVLRPYDYANGQVGVSTDQAAGGGYVFGSGITLSNKVIAISAAYLGDVYQDGEAVAHELVHALVPSSAEPWSSEQMRQECRHDPYHNDEGGPWAYGFRITTAGVEDRALMFGARDVMGGAGSASQHWIGQCTYWHLLKVLADPPDPPLVLVQGSIDHTEGQWSAELGPMYQLDGAADLAPGDGGETALVLRGASGETLGRFPFTPTWQPADGASADVAGFAVRVPELPGITQVDLVGPGDVVLASRAYADEPPSVSVSELPAPAADAADGTASLHVSWSGTDPGGAPLLYTLLYSADDGQTWTERAFETADTEMDIAVDAAAAEHQVKVIATNGSRSAEAVSRAPASGGVQVGG